MRAVWPVAFLAASFLLGPLFDCFSLDSISFCATAYAQSDIVVDDEIERQQQKIALALSKRGSVDAVEMRLCDVIADLGQQFQIPIVLSRKKLEEASVSPDTPVTRQLVGLSLESILHLVLRDLELA